MMASDIPESYSSPARMARSLSTYIDDPREVRRRVLEMFTSCPCTSTIRGYRRQYLRIDYIEPCKPHDGYSPDEARKKAAKANAVFLARILNERAASAALKSTYLTRPELVDNAWERACR